MPTNKKDLIRHLKEAAKNNSLMTPKHNPYNLGTVMSGYRTVLSYDLADNLDNFIDSGDFAAVKYSNTNFPNSPLYIEIIPNPTSNYIIPSSGVTSCSPVATSALDRLVVVSGQTQGLHIYGESSSKIQNKFTNGDLTDKTELI